MSLPPNPPPPPPAGPTIQNRLPAENINTSDEHPLKEFAWLIVAALVTLALAVAVISAAARWIAPKLPFRHEEALAARVLDLSKQPTADVARSAALQTLADRVAATMSLPDGMTIKLRYVDADIVNAYATVGGHVRIYRGLLEKLPSEDALVALLAHEIGHVKHRHVSANLGRGLALSMLLGVISTDAGAAAARGVLGQAASVALLSYSRDQETESDTEAIDAVVALYGHGRGYEELFDTMRKAEAQMSDRLPGGGGPTFELLRSHPLTEARSAHARARAAARGWSMQGEATPLPEVLKLKPKAKSPSAPDAEPSR